MASQHNIPKNSCSRANESSWRHRGNRTARISRPEQRTTGNAAAVMLPISRSSRRCLDGNSYSSRSTARNFPAGGFGERRAAWTSSLYPVPCESVILVWYQRNSRAACLLSFRCNNERPEKEGEREEWKRWKERKKRKEAALLILRIFLYSDSPCPRSRQSRRYYLISPASFPFYRANPSYANVRP